MYTGDVYIALHQTYSAATFYGFGVDDFTVEEIPACLIPSDISSSNITTLSADISWTSDATNFNVEYGAEGFTQGSGTTDTSAIASYSLTGLSSNTSYDIYVQTNCGSSGVSEWAGPYTFVTECDAVTAFPYTEDFDTDWSCWTVVNADSDSYTWSQSSTYISPRSGLYTAHGMGSNDDYLISPKFTLTGNERVVWYDIVESSAYNNTYDVLISTTGKNIADFTTNLGTYDCTNTSWEEHILDLSMYTGDVYIALHQTYSAATFYGFGVDDFTVEEIPSCSAPTALSVANITTTSADISWTSDGTLFNIEYGPAGFTQGSGTSDTSATASYALTGLNSGSAYDVYVQTDCGATDGTSSWSLLNLSTLLVNDSCDTATVLDALPFTSNGDATAATNNNGTIVVTDCGYGMNDGVWYTFTPTVSGTIDLVIDPTGWDAEIAVYTGSCGVFTCVDSADSGGFSDSESLSIAITAGTQYFVNLGHYSGSSDNSEGVYVFGATSTDASLGIEETSISQFTYFPNPVNDVLTIKAQKVVEDITVFNMLGQVVKQQTPNTMDCTVDLSAMQSGAYFVKVSIGNNVETVRILKK
jgi:hypothetical protein